MTIDEQWAEYVYGRSVAIVGPAEPTHDQSAEIDAHDIVIRIGWVNAARLHPDYGTKADVAFYNKAASSWFSKRGHADVSGLDFVLVKAWYGVTDRALCRQVPGIDGLNANQVPLLLHDLARFAPGPVSVFGADFYWNPDLAYTNLYTEIAAEAKPKLVGRSMPERLNGHDWDRQRQVCREAMKWLDVVGDDRFLRVMGLSDVEYREGMLRAYPGLLPSESA